FRACLRAPARRSRASSGSARTLGFASIWWTTCDACAPPCRADHDRVDFSLPKPAALRMPTPRYYTEPVLTLLSRPNFLSPDHLAVNWIGESTEGERLAE